MGRSSYTFDTTVPNHAIPHHSRGYPLDKRPAPRPGNAAASLHSTALDYARFLQAVLRSELLSAGGPPRASGHLTDVAEGVGWGLEWGLEYPDGRESPALWHWGDNGPFKAFAYLDPSSGVGFVYFANSTNRLSILSRVLNRLFPARHPLLDWLEYEQAG